MAGAGPFDAYIDEALFVAGDADGPLSGTSFAAKDLYDVSGHTSCCGNPDWGRTHRPAVSHAVAVEKLLRAGADLKGKTITDEFAFSIIGENHHYGTPVNPNAPGRVCGGSSSGSAAAVAGGLVDFALGTDTGGSVRVPASFCGIFGLRPTHGRVSLDGVFPLAPSFDTAGWFAADPSLMAAVGAILLQDYRPLTNVAQVTLLYPEDIWAEAEPSAVEALAPAVAALEERFGTSTKIRITDGADTIGDWFECFRVTQGAEIWSVLGNWITETNPDIGPGIRERLEWCATIAPKDAAREREKREEIARRVHEVTGDGAILVMPAAPGPALRAGEDAVRSNAVRAKIIRMSGIAPLAKVPQMSLPLAKVDGFPVALSLLGAPGNDEVLLQMAKGVAGVAVKGIAAVR